MTLTIDIPEDVAARLRDIPEPERQTYAVAWMRAGILSGDTDARGPRREKPYQVMQFAGAHPSGRSGAEVDEDLRQQREEWDESPRVSSWRR